MQNGKRLHFWKIKWENTAPIRNCWPRPRRGPGTRKWREVAIGPLLSMSRILKCMNPSCNPQLVEIWRRIALLWIQVLKSRPLDSVTTSLKPKKPILIANHTSSHRPLTKTFLTADKCTSTKWCTSWTQIVFRKKQLKTFKRWKKHKSCWILIWTKSITMQVRFTNSLIELTWRRSDFSKGERMVARPIGAMLMEAGHRRPRSRDQTWSRLNILTLQEVNRIC